MTDGYARCLEELSLSLRILPTAFSCLSFSVGTWRPDHGLSSWRAASQVEFLPLGTLRAGIFLFVCSLVECKYLLFNEETYEISILDDESILKFLTYQNPTYRPEFCRIKVYHGILYLTLDGFSPIAAPYDTSEYWFYGVTNFVRLSLTSLEE